MPYFHGNERRRSKPVPAGQQQLFGPGIALGRAASEGRVRLTIVVMVIPVVKGKLMFERMFPAVTKEFSTPASRWCSTTPFAGQRRLGFRWERSMRFVRARLHMSPMGAGFSNSACNYRRRPHRRSSGLEKYPLILRHGSGWRVERNHERHEIHETHERVAGRCTLCHFPLSVSSVPPWSNSFLLPLSHQKTLFPTPAYRVPSILHSAFCLLPFPSLLPQSPLLLKKLREDLAARLAEHAGNDLRAVVQARIIQQSVERMDRAGLRISGAVDEHGNPRQQNCPGTHRTRFERDVERAAIQSPRVERLGGLRDGDHFRMSRGIAKLLALVVRCRDDLILMDNNRSNRHLIFLRGRFGLLQSQSHIILVHKTLLKRNTTPPHPFSTAPPV